MAAVTGDEVAEGLAPQPSRRPRRGIRQFPVWRWLILILVECALSRHPAGRGAAVHRFPPPSRRSSSRKGSPRPSSCRSSWPSSPRCSPSRSCCQQVHDPELSAPAAPAHGGGHDPAYRDPAGGPDRGRAGDSARIPEEHAVLARADLCGARDAVRLPGVRCGASCARSADAGRGGPVAGRGLAVHAVAGHAAQPAHGDALGHRPDRGPGPRRVHHGQPGPVSDVPGVDRRVRPDQRADLGRGLAAGAVRDLDLPAGDHDDGAADHAGRAAPRFRLQSAARTQTRGS